LKDRKTKRKSYTHGQNLGYLLGIEWKRHYHLLYHGQKEGGELTPPFNRKHLGRDLKERGGRPLPALNRTVSATSVEPQKRKVQERREFFLHTVDDEELPPPLMRTKLELGTYRGDFSERGIVEEGGVLLACEFYTLFLLRDEGDTFPSPPRSLPRTV